MSLIFKGEHGGLVINASDYGSRGREFEPHSGVYMSLIFKGGRDGLVVNALDSGSRGRGFEPHSGQTVLCP